MALPILGAVTAGIGAVGEIAKAFSGDDQTVQGLELPPEFELQLIDAVDQDLASLNTEFQRITDLEQAFNDRIGALEGIVSNTLPTEEGLRALRDSSVRIATNLGQSAEELISNGFLDEDDIADLDELANLEGRQERDPALERQLADERARLEQDLRRSGASPAVRAQALSQFDRTAEESRFRRAEELREGRGGRISQRIGLRSDLRERGFNRAVRTSDLLNRDLTAARQGAEQLAGLAGARFDAGTQAQGIRSGLRGERRTVFENLGQFNISDRTLESLANRGPKATGSSSETIGVNPATRTRLGRISNEDLLNRIRNIEFAKRRGGASEREQASERDAIIAEATRRGL